MMQLCLASVVVVLGVVHGAVVQPGGEHNVVQMDHHRVASMVYEDQWRQYKQMFGKSYSDIEDGFRRDIFAENLRLVQEHYQRYMNGEVSFLMDINRFSDMEHSEFVRQMNGYRRPANRTGGAMYMSPLAGVEVPDTVDWRTEGYVTPVKNQEQCGSCWAFSTTGSLEGQHFRATGDLVSLSEQQLVDCSGDYGNMGCGGGLMDNAFRYIKENGGLDTEDSYPYTAEDQDCSFNPQTIGATCTGYVDIPAGDEEALKEAIANNGPVSVAIDASHVSFQSYTSGVYDEPDCDSEMLDHGVLAVGYGTEDGKDYWLVKNSWGEDWGDQGYIKMSRNKDNQCGIATAASYPTV